MDKEVEKKLEEAFEELEFNDEDDESKEKTQ